jgi:hypothetical protein
MASCGRRRGPRTCTTVAGSGRDRIGQSGIPFLRLADSLRRCLLRFCLAHPIWTHRYVPECRSILH